VVGLAMRKSGVALCMRYGGGKQGQMSMVSSEGNGTRRRSQHAYLDSQDSQAFIFKRMFGGKDGKWG